ncbi:ABC transporter permease [Lederbergia citrea]|uniref:ABC transporter permease n=1 Tax=Lederbergia citrea TaxID=2833581 RepID=A0A942UMI4_9BACI|nr:ABC transporter permease [Lederbergia citrea]MBS4176750.1 ABC transporter permease [Lederbergia citrea]MBS4203311.1 ABC transporter permease [Lederbergia citrea]MBS4222017.1 ABC transporter permease [Lederbergia citrea]
MIVKWAAKRIGMSIAVLFLVSLLGFSIMHLAPGDPATAFYGGNVQTLTTFEKERINQAFGLNRSVSTQYISWLREALVGNFGFSSREGRPVLDIVMERVPNTLILFSVSMVFIIIFSIALGMKAGMNEGSILDKGLSIASIASSSLPAFWIGILLIWIFSVQLGILPSSGTADISGKSGFLDKCRHLILPAFVLIVTHVGIYARFLQENIKEEIKKYYCIVAKANGVSQKELNKGILRNASLPYLNYLGMTIPSFFGGSIIIESLFAWSGLGQLSVKATMTKDFPLLMGCILITGIIVVATMLIIDLLTFLLNPKLRQEEMGR